MKRKNLPISIALLSPISCLAETSDNHPSTTETGIAFLPVIFFLLISIVTIIKLRNDKTKLSNLLAEKDTTAVAANTATPPQSVSRFIAFMSGLVAISLSVCISAFYMYVYFGNSSAKIDLSSLTSVIWGLGIGVIPYGANKLSTALKSNT
jgi:hypothetical protein